MQYNNNRKTSWEISDIKFKLILENLTYKWLKINLNVDDKERAISKINTDRIFLQIIIMKLKIFIHFLNMILWLKIVLFNSGVRS